MDRLDFGKVLFDETDTIVVCAYQQDRGKETDLANFANTPGQFFVINAAKGGRKGENVTSFRNFLIEFDEMSLEAQMEYVKAIQMPYSTALYSGGKSVHFIISLETPLTDVGQYDHFSTYLHNVVKKADPSTKSSCKLSRYPNVRRTETGKLQEVKEIRGRVKNQDFISWLEQHSDCVPRQKSVTTNFPSGRESVIDILDWYVLEYLKASYRPNSVRTFVRCPICADEGCDTREDNMCITHDSKYFHCFKNTDHDKKQLSRMIYLKRDLGDARSDSAAEEWKRHNEEKMRVADVAAKELTTLNENSEITVEELMEVVKGL